MAIKCECIEKYGIIRHFKAGGSHGTQSYRVLGYGFCTGCSLYYHSGVYFCDHCGKKLRKMNYSRMYNETLRESLIIRY